MSKKHNYAKSKTHHIGRSFGRGKTVIRRALESSATWAILVEYTVMMHATIVALDGAFGITGGGSEIRRENDGQAVESERETHENSEARRIRSRFINPARFFLSEPLETQPSFWLHLIETAGGDGGEVPIAWISVARYRYRVYIRGLTFGRTA
ncbi:hypothetical protein C8F04DRAFT_1181664 [Mycena alexandri]|uniref:Uncharacterized protein n=1 Tax=Mycena alexandri TaxID=1745969 RepID=A0AAD6X491_9AGAR|nr:hypothetical protein C8F04DRAFT_1181664 [Mycena alexandri]